MNHQPTHHNPPSGLLARLREAHGDDRGVALQTVIIIVVMLAIAGAVAAVLFNRASDVTNELETADVTGTKIDTKLECESHTMGSKGGVPTSGTCTWQETGLAQKAAPQEVTAGACRLARGTLTLTNQSSAGSATCVVSDPGIQP